MTEKQCAEIVEKELTERYGFLLNLEAIRKCLAFPSTGALQQAINRKVLPFEVFKIEKRKGKFAFAKDVAKWLASQRYKLESTK